MSFSAAADNSVGEDLCASVCSCCLLSSSVCLWASTACKCSAPFACSAYAQATWAFFTSYPDELLGGCDSPEHHNHR